MTHHKNHSHKDHSAKAQRGLMLVLSSPSGAGKTTLTRDLLASKTLDLTLSISVTTRPRRSSEIDGVHYHFMTPRAFEAMRDAGELLEWAEVHGNYYGTPLAPVTAMLNAGRDMLFDLDFQGAQQCRDKMGRDVVSVFILPPSMGELQARLERRAEDAPDVIARRLKNAREEIAHWHEYDYILINDDKQKCYDELVAILQAELLRRFRQEVWLREFVEQGLLKAPQL